MGKIKNLVVGAAFVAAAATSSIATAADSVNVAFFLEWATPNQIAKVQKTYDEALGLPVKWTNFNAGTAMTDAMLAGDIDISYSQGLAPFVTAIQQGAPLKMVAIAVVYSPNPCIVRSDLGIDSSNASELEGKTVAVPLNTMADFSFRKQMEALNVDISTMKIVDQAPPDGSASLVDKAVDMACLFGGNSINKAKEVGAPIMSDAETKAAGIGSFDVISVTEKFATENPDLLRTFLEVTEEANAAWKGSDDQLAIVAQDAGMSVTDTKSQMADFSFPSAKEQLDTYFGDGGIAAAAAQSLGTVFEDSNSGNYKGTIAAVIDGSYLK